VAKRAARTSPNLTEPPGTAAACVAALKKASTRQDFANLKRFGIDAPTALGVSMANIQKIAKPLGRDHALAEALWKTGVYEARMLASFVDEPEKVTPAQMDRWCHDFDNWGICDTVCFKLFDRSPHAFARIAKWSASKEEFVKRGAFALLASLALHDKSASDAAFLKTLPLIERAATDERNFVKKGVSWALRGIGHRSPKLWAAAMATADRLAASEDATARWIGRDALKDLKRFA
jgi:3-methyladenine DNA glycosylase AlkD